MKKLMVWAMLLSSAAQAENSVHLMCARNGGSARLPARLALILNDKDVGFNDYDGQSQVFDYLERDQAFDRPGLARYEGMDEVYGHEYKLVVEKALLASAPGTAELKRSRDGEEFTARYSCKK